jgi:hypothetical protein
MIEILVPILSTALIGVLGWYLIELRTNYVIRKTVKTFLIEVIKPIVLTIKDESDNGEKSQIDKVHDFVDLSKGDQFLTTSHFPLFNSNLLKGFPINRLRVSYYNSERFVALMNVIGYLDGFQNRMPNDIQKQWVDFINQHQKECKVSIKRCAGVRSETRLYQSNLEHTKDMAEKLLIEIEKTIG